MKPTVPDDGAIQQQIGSAYDVVKSVADNLPAIIAVTSAVEEAQQVIEDITEQVQLATTAANNASAVVGQIDTLKNQAIAAKDLAEDYRDESEVAKNIVVGIETTLTPRLNTFNTNYPVFVTNYADFSVKYGAVVTMHDDVDADRIAAENARNKAEKWASEAVDVLVETGKFSAIHWATKASGFRDAASAFATTAGTHATNAGNSASTASTAANTATTRASEAASDRTLAQTAASSANTSANNASTSATTASTAATTATTKATEASTSATNAASSATSASNSATTATNAATTATNQATSATNSATTATTQAGIATTKASEAATSASQALTHRNDTSGFRDLTFTYMGRAEQAALDAEAAAGGDFVPSSRTVNNKSLNTNIVLNAVDVGARADTWLPTFAQITSIPAVLTNIGSLVTSADTIMYFTAANTPATSAITAFARSILDDTDAATVRSTLGLGSAATQASTAFQAADADLTAIAGLTGATGFLRKTALDTWTLDTSTYLTGNQTITFTGEVTGTGTTSIPLSLANSGVTAGTYRSVTVTAKGIVTGGTNPTTLAGYGITDAHPLTSSLTTFNTNVAAAGSGIFKKTAANTWSFATLVSGDIPNLDTGKITTGTLSVARGGTGKNTLTGIVFGNGTSAFTTATAAQIVAAINGTPVANATAAVTATRLATAVNINGIPFDGSAAITIPAPGSVATADALTTARAITVTGDADWTVTFKGDLAVSAPLTLKNVVTAGTGTKITYNAKGLVTGSEALVEADIPNLSWSKITSGVPSFALTSDVRFTDAREWTAATVTQAVAEAGTDTTRTAWTAERVKQAITAQAAPKVSTDSRLTALENAPDASGTAKKALALAIMGL
jgi:phage-related tail fiber protein